MAKMGRPQKQIDREQFEKLCSIQCTLEEIAGVFRCSEDTIERWCKREIGKTFAEAYKVYSVNGKISLRRLQFKLAEKSAAMAIFLGKQYLGQTDKVETSLNTIDPETKRAVEDMINEATKRKTEEDNNIPTGLSV